MFVRATTRCRVRHAGAVALAVGLGMICAVPAADPVADYAAITQMRDLFIRTELVTGGHPRAVIVVPEGGVYRELVGAVQRAVGVPLPVRTDVEVTPESILKDTHVIALGNMATSRFIRRLYFQYYTYLDLWYPGKGGYVVRSLHNPLGTGKNVLFIGGSDAAGVAMAARAFGTLLEKKDQHVSVGRLMEIRLGPALKPPGLASEAPIQSWKDSWRKDGRRHMGYPPAGRFGWHPISHSAALYYMTGERAYLDQFLDRALTRGEARRSHEASGASEGRRRVVNNDPLAKLQNHYKAFFIPTLWDLIEESPHITDTERLAVINALWRIDQTGRNEAGWARVTGKVDPPRPRGRHTDYETLTEYTISRYFAKYYPRFAWPKANLEEVKKYFSAWELDPYSGGSNPAGYTPSVAECIFDYYLLSGNDAFATSGGAHKMLEGLWILWEGTPNTLNSPLNLLRKAAWYLDTPQYTWFANLPTYDLSVFRIGQSYALSEELGKAEPPTWLPHTIQRLPLPRWQRPKRIAPDEGYLMLTYRTTLDAGGDLFMLDGHGGGGSQAHIQALRTLRIAGRSVLDGRRWGGWGSQLIIRQSGLAPARGLPRVAAVKKTVALDGMAYVHSRTEGFDTASWDRYMLHLAGERMVVVDQVDATEPGTFDIRAEWHVFGPVRTPADAPAGFARTGKEAVVCCATPVPIRAAPWEPGSGWSTIGQLHKADIAPSKLFVAMNLLYPKGHPHATLRKLGARSAVVVLPKGEAHFVGLGAFSGRGLNVQAELAYLAPGRIVLIGGTGLDVAGTRWVQTDKPVDLSWRPADGSVQVQVAAGPAAVRFAAGQQQTLSAGLHRLALPARPAADLAAVLRTLTPDPLPTVAVTPKAQADWQPAWQAAVGQRITDMAVPKNGRPGLWVAGQDGKLALLRNGKLVKELTLGTPIRDVALASGPRPMVLVACADWTARAYTAAGDPLWTYTCKPIPTDRWRAAHLAANEPDKDGLSTVRWTGPKLPDPNGTFAVVPLNGSAAQLAVVSLFSVDLLDRTGRRLKRADYLDTWRGPQGCIPNTVIAPLPPDMVRHGGRNGFVAGASRVCLNSYPFAVTWEPDGAIEAKRAYKSLARGQAGMGGMKVRYLRDLRIADLDRDGKSEVLYTLSGKWSELRVYDRDRKPLWRRAMGPAKKNSAFLRSMDCGDCDGDGMQEVAAGCEDGWVYLFRHDGTLAWSRRLEVPVASVLVLPGAGIVVGCTNGTVLRLAAEDGRTLRVAKLPAEVHILRLARGPAGSGPQVVAATQAGQLAGLALD